MAIVLDHTWRACLLYDGYQRLKAVHHASINIVYIIQIISVQFAQQQSLKSPMHNSGMSLSPKNTEGALPSYSSSAAIGRTFANYAVILIASSFYRLWAFARTWRDEGVVKR